MYFLMIVLPMFILPIVSILTELLIFKSAAGAVPVIGKWFVFWAVGARLFLAGLRQSFTPQFTAEQIFGIQTKEPLIIVQELGFANLSTGILGLITMVRTSWIMPAAVAGGLFYGLAGLRHVAKKDRNRLETNAMLSDLFVFIVLLIYLVGASVQ